MPNPNPDVAIYIDSGKILCVLPNIAEKNASTDTEVNWIIIPPTANIKVEVDFQGNSPCVKNKINGKGRGKFGDKLKKGLRKQDYKYSVTLYDSNNNKLDTVDPIIRV